MDRLAAGARERLDLPDLGEAPELRGITEWINSEPLTLHALRGQVVLVHFWTFDCINCQNVQPYVKRWHGTHAEQGLRIIGIHTPELDIERDPANVRAAVRSNGVTFAVGIDAGYDTWDAYRNRYWPAFYWIDRSGRIRFTHFGEGEYAEQERVIRALLAT
jgi:thiol-disulfide isomerase/thioredoxin